MSYWILKSSRPDWLNALTDGHPARWPHDKFSRAGVSPKVGDIVFLWAAGKSAGGFLGIVAAGIVTMDGTRLGVTVCKPPDFEPVSLERLKQEPLLVECEFLKPAQSSGIHAIGESEVVIIAEYLPASVQACLRLPNRDPAVEVYTGLNDLEGDPCAPNEVDRARGYPPFRRDSAIRTAVRARALGKCEYCKERGFPLPNGGWYIETHHIIALAKDGKDTLGNVIALCPNHHREAHYGQGAEKLEQELTAILAEILAPC